MDLLATRRQLHRFTPQSRHPPQVVLPQAVLPQMVLPQAVLPQVILPQVILPQVILPQVILPQVILPQVILPQVVLPQVILPQVVLPQVILPQAVLPQVILPQAVLPQVVLPQMVLLQVILPQVILHQLVPHQLIPHQPVPTVVGVGDGFQVSFTAFPIEGQVPLTVQFNDTSTGNVTSWLWDFGDGNISTSQNPIHTYYEIGNYSVTLNASNTYEYSVFAWTDYITVTGEGESSGAALETGDRRLGFR